MHRRRCLCCCTLQCVHGSPCRLRRRCPPRPANSDFLFHLFFASNCATIMTGAVLGRVTLHGYLWSALWVGTFVHPFVARWVWSACGGVVSSVACPATLLETDPPPCMERWGNGFVDLAGGMVVHGVGGIAAFVLALWTPPSTRQRTQLLSPDQCTPVCGVCGSQLCNSVSSRAPSLLRSGYTGCHDPLVCLAWVQRGLGVGYDQPPLVLRRSSDGGHDAGTGIHTVQHHTHQSRCILPRLHRTR